MPAAYGNRTFRKSVQAFELTGYVVYCMIEPVRNRDLRRVEKTHRVNLDYLQSGIFDELFHLFYTHHIDRKSVV